MSKCIHVRLQGMGITHGSYITRKGSSPQKQMIAAISGSKGNMFSSKQNLFNCVTKWGQPEWGLCAQPSAGAASGRLQWGHEQTVALETTLWCLNLCAGSQVSFLVSAILQTQLRTSFTWLFSKQQSANQQESITEKLLENLTEVTPSLILPCIYTRKQTKWRSHKNNKHSVLGPGLLGCLVVHENHQIRIDKMGLEFSFQKKKKRKFLIS